MKSGSNRTKAILNSTHQLFDNSYCIRPRTRIITTFTVQKQHEVYRNSRHIRNLLRSICGCNEIKQAISNL